MVTRRADFQGITVGNQERVEATERKMARLRCPSSLYLQKSSRLQRGIIYSGNGLFHANSGMTMANKVPNEE